MKKTDYAMIILIASLSILISYFAGKAIVGDNSLKPVEVQTVAPIVETVEKPDPKVFNKDAINPTVEVIIGDQAG